ncbi:hypothetical protein SLS62_007547 [Diatrype stigma]|uniref:Uncharacterized protein n=1 Tax=Diatrype stigma TaxID=117547 RepID=A0AAN9YM67_9PEZI
MASGDPSYPFLPGSQPIPGEFEESTIINQRHDEKEEQAKIAAQAKETTKNPVHKSHKRGPIGQPTGNIDFFPEAYSHPGLGNSSLSWRKPANNMAGNQSQERRSLDEASRPRTSHDSARATTTGTRDESRTASAAPRDSYDELDINKLDGSTRSVQAVYRQVISDSRITARLGARVGDLQDSVTQLSNQFANFTTNMGRQIQENVREAMGQSNNQTRTPVTETHIGNDHNSHQRGSRSPDRRDDFSDTHHYPASQNQSSSGHKLKKNDIGIFDPHEPDPEGIGLIPTKTPIIFTDAYAFRDRINSFLEDRASRADYERQLLTLFQTLLAGPAVVWWNSELQEFNRTQLRATGIQAMLSALINRFRPDAAMATAQFSSSYFVLRDLAENENALQTYVMKKLRWARAMGTLADNNVNWYGVMMQVWSHTDLAVKQYLRQPLQHETLEMYMLQVEQSKATLLALASQKYPAQARSGNSKVSYHGNAQSSSRSSKQSRGRDYDEYPREPRNRNYQRNRSRPRYDYQKENEHTEYLDTYRPRYGDRRNDDRRDNRRDDRRGNYRDDKRGDQRDNQREENRPADKRDGQNERRGRRDDGRDRRGGGQGYREKVYKGRDGVHWADQGGDSEDQSGSAKDVDSSDESSQDSEDDEKLYMVLEKSLTCHQCLRTFPTAIQRRRHLKKCVMPKAVVSESIQDPSPASATRRTCGICHDVFPSRNKLFKHLQQSCEPSAASQAQDEQTEQAFQAQSADPPIESKPPTVKTAPPLGPNDGSVLSSYTHARAKARATPKGPDFEVCMDLGAGRTFIKRSILLTLDHSIEARPGKVQGIGKKKMEEWATFKFYLPGKGKNGEDVITEFEKQGWVLDGEEHPDMLVGNDFMHPYGASIDLTEGYMTFAALDNFQIDVDVQLRSRAVVRKVTNHRKVTLAAGQRAYIPVNYKALPNDRSFSFIASHPQALGAVIDAKTPQVVVVQNTSSHSITIPKNARMGTIQDSTDSGYFVASWAGGMKALALAALATGAAVNTPTATAQDPHTYGVVNDMTPMNVEFNLTPAMTAVATDTVPHNIDDLTELSHAQSETAYAGDGPNSSTPVTDAVFNTIVTSGAYDEVQSPLAKPEPDKPRIPAVHSTLGIKKPINMPERVTSEGVHIYNEDQSFAAHLEKIVHEYPELWVDKGPVDVPLEEQMKVPLVDNWQNHNLQARSYPLGRKDMEFLNQKFDHLHGQGRQE